MIGVVSAIGSFCGFRAGEVAAEFVRVKFRTLRVGLVGRYVDGVVLLLAAVLVAI